MLELRPLSELVDWIKQNRNANEFVFDVIGEHVPFAQAKKALELPDESEADGWGAVYPLTVEQIVAEIRAEVSRAVAAETDGAGRRVQRARMRLAGLMWISKQDALMVELVTSGKSGTYEAILTMLGEQAP